MKYYKIIKDNSFIGATYSGRFVAQSPNNGRLFYANEITGQFVKYNGNLYRDYWMAEIGNSAPSFLFASIINITEEEYNTLMEAIHNNEIIEVEDEDNTEEPLIPPVDPTPDETIEFIRTSKIKEMSYTCRTTIENGFDIELRNETHHFSLDTQDQLNLISLSAMAQTQEMVPYHADGESCIFYTAAEMQQIIAAATTFKIYHTTYYNALKGYINSLETIEEISAITYGTAIPDEYKTDVLRALEA